MAKKQTEIPGTERKVNKAIEEKAQILRKHRTARLKKQQDEADAQADLLETMKAEKVSRYRWEEDGVEMEVVVDDVTKVRVRKVKAEGDDE